jgi:hypothetical protein
VALAEPVPFTGKIVGLNYEKYWDNSNYTKLGANFMGIDLSLKIERGSVTSLEKSTTSPVVTDFLNIKRQGRAGIGIGFKIKSPGGKFHLGPIKGGAWAEGGAGTTFTGITEDSYKFDYFSANNWQAIAKYILIADANFKNISVAAGRFLSLLESKFSNQPTLEESFVSDGGGIDVKKEISAEGFVGVELAHNATIGAGASVGAEGHPTLLAFNHHIDNEYEYNFGVSGKFAGSAGFGIKMDFGNKNKKEDLGTMLSIYDTESSVGLQFSTFLDGDIPSQIKRFELKYIRRNLFSNFEEETLFSIEADDEVLNEISTLTSEIQQISNSHQSSTNINVNNSTFKQILDAVFDFLYDIQVNQAGNATISYQKEMTKISHCNSFDIDLGVSITAASLNFGGGVGFEEGKKMTVEKGKWVFGEAYINEKFSSEIPEIPISYQQVLQQVIDDVPMLLKLGLGIIDAIIPGKDNMTFYVGNNGSSIIFPDNAFPPEIDSIHCISWSWYGADPSKKLADVEQDKKFIFKENKLRAEEVYGMQYGIGGFYQFEPYGTQLADTCWMTIVYDQAEADSLDESSLGMYWEDKANHRWVYIGGVLDTANNTLTAPITQLSLFTLAPAMPFGTFGLNAVPDSIYADSISVATIFSDTIFNNNLRPVNDGEKFTVATTNGKILTVDADTTIDGIQVVAGNHQIQFEVRSSHIGGTATVSAFSVNGSATASTNIRFYDTIPPAPPVLVEAFPDSTITNLSWLPNTEEDLSGYVLYFDTDTIPPFEGIHTVYGQPSPIYTGTDTTRMVYGLFNDTTYYFTLTAVDVEGNESGYSNFKMAKPFTLSSQKIQLLQGWSGISSYLSPSTDNIEPLFQPILSDLIILQNTSGIYWPGQNINTIGAWNTHEGYQIKVANAVDLTISGTRENNKTLQLAAGWNLIPVLSECEVDVAALFAGKDVVIIKEVAGWNIYWPEFGINSLGVLEPGKAYFVLMGNDGTIEFPVCGAVKVGFENLKASPDLSAFKISTTPITHTIAIPEMVANALIEGDIISVYDLSGNCFGMGNWQAQTTAITLFGDDPTTNIKDGFEEDEPLQFRLYRQNVDKEFEMEVTFNPAMPNPERIFNGNGLSVITEMTLLPVSMSSIESGSEVLIIPNPANDEFTLVIGDHTFEKGVLTIYTIDGRFIKTENIDVHHTNINISEMRSGVYLLKIEYGNKIVNKRLLKK